MPDLQVSSPLLIYLVRHGETEANRESRFSGRADSPLTDLGVREARRHGRVLRGLIADGPGPRFVSSPLARALHSAELIRAELGLAALEIETEARLTEISFGSWEGLTRAEIEESYPGEWDRRHREMWTYVVPGGESYEMVARRAGAWLGEAEGPMVVVTHGAVDRILRGLYAGLPEPEICHLAEPQDVFFKLADGAITPV